MEDAIKVVLGQPLGLAVLIVLVYTFATDKLVTGSRYDKLESANEELSASVTKLADAAEDANKTTDLLLSIVRGIDDRVRAKGGDVT